MGQRLVLNSRVRLWLIAGVLAIFAGCGYQHYSEDTGDDLSASYVGCRLLASGQGVAHLYAHDPGDFAAVGEDAAWQGAAEAAGYEGWLHPYVQTPLWAWSLEPLCTRMSFPAFDRVFAAGMLLCFAALASLVARVWAPRLWTPWAMAAVLGVLWFCTPFTYAMLLVQTHVLFVLMTVAALMCAERRWAAAGGVLLAVAAAVKITPAVFVVYWLVCRRWRAAAWFAVASAMLFGAAVLVAGRPLVGIYLATLGRASRVLLVSENNQSLAATVMGRFYPASEVALMRVHPLPASLRIAGSGLMVLCAVGCGWWDRRLRRRAPLGALTLLVAATVLTPIAWTHYSIVLLPPLMVAADVALRRRSWWLALGVAAVVVLNLPPLASDVIEQAVGRWAILRGQFFAGMGAMLLMAACARRAEG